MTDEMAKRLRDLVGMQVGDVPVMIHQAADYIDALAAKLAEVEAEREVLQRMVRDTRIDPSMHTAMKARAEAAEAALGAAYRLALGDAAIELECNWGHIATPQMRDHISALPTPTAEELMARINEGKTDDQ